MPANSLGLLAVVVPVHAAEDHTFSPQDTTVVLSGIPFPEGTTLHLPSEAQSGDRYGFADVDGSCSPQTPIQLAAPPGTTIAGGASALFVEPFQAAAAEFDEASKSWAIVSKSSNALVPGLNLVDNGIAAPVTLTSAMQDLITIGPSTFPKGVNVFLVATVNASSPTVNAYGKLSAQILIDGGVPLRGGNRPTVDVVPAAGQPPSAQVTVMFQFFVAPGSHTFKLQASSTVPNMVADAAAPGCEMTIFVFGPVA
jgi:hypothetical protein